MATSKNPRKKRTDSADAMLEAAKNAALPDLMPPPHVQISAGAMPYYRDILRARSRAEWNDFQLTVAAQLAECMAKQIEIEAELMVDGLTIEGVHGPKPHPLVAILERMASRQQSLARSLQMVGRVALGDPRANTKQRELEEKARQLHAETAAEQDDLLA